MRVSVQAKVNSRRPRVHELPATAAGRVALEVAVAARPIDGEANAAIARALAQHFAVPISCVQLVRGASSRRKLFEITR